MDVEGPVATGPLPALLAVLRLLNYICGVPAVVRSSFGSERDRLLILLTGYEHGCLGSLSSSDCQTICVRAVQPWDSMANNPLLRSVR